ncbi:MAG: hypothetical protein ABI776_06970, partial [Nocardioidaceae bacterium]
LAERARPDDGRFAALADLVTARSGPGRGRAQQPLGRPGDAARRIGAPAVDPADLPVEELLRIGIGALAELLLAAPAHSEPERVRRRRLLTRSPAFVLDGAPVTTSAVRRALGAAGHVEGGRSPRVVLLAQPVDRGLAQVWSARVQAGAPVRWAGFVQRWAERDVLPGGADVPGLARLWADRLGAERVHVVVATSEESATARTVAEVLGVRVGPGGASPGPGPEGLSGAAVDVARRVNAVLAVRAAQERHAVLLRRLVGTLSREPSGPALTVPEAFADWARGRGVRMGEELSAGDYPVLGRPAALVPGGDLPSHPRRAETLEVVLAACLTQADLCRRSGEQ